MIFLGDYELGETINFRFCTAAPDTGAPATLSGTPAIAAYVGNSATQITAGLTLGVDHDSVTGLNLVTAVLTSGNGYADNTDIDFVITTGTVDGNSAVGYVIGRCTLGRSSAYRRLGAPAGASVSADIAAIEAQTDDIGAAGAGLTAVPWNSAWDAEVQSEVTDALNAYDPPTKAELDAADDAILAVLGTPSDFGSGTSTLAANLQDLADNGTATFDRSTDSLQAIRDHIGNGSNLTEAGGTGDHLTAVPWNAAWDAEVQSEATDALNAYDPPTRAELTSDIGTVTTAISGLNDLSAAEVNAQVVDALNTDTYAEPGQGAPGATITLAAKIGYLYKAWRNRSTQTATEYALYADDATTKDQEAAVSDDGSTLDRGEVTTGA